MKKYLIIMLAVTMIWMIHPAAMAGTIGIGVEPGVTVGVSKDNLSEPETNVYAAIGLNDKLWVSPGYKLDAKIFTLGARYAFSENMAVELDYTADAANSYVAYFRMKQDCGEKLGIIEELSYDSVNVGFKGQGEYSFTEDCCGNIGLAYLNSTVFVILGGEFHVSKFTVGFDYTVDTGSGGNGAATVYAEYKF
jgi:hypothetical protein